MVAGLEDVGIAEDQQRPGVRVGHQVQRRFEDGDQRAFRADQGAGDMKAVFRQQRVEVVAGDAARQLAENAGGSRRHTCRGTPSAWRRARRAAALRG